IETGSAPAYRVVKAESAGAVDEAERIQVEVIRLDPEPGRPRGRKFGLLVHEILQRANTVDEVEALARIWRRRHGVPEQDCEAAAVAARAALERLTAMAPAGARSLREMEVTARLADGRLVEGRIDFAWSDGERWTVVDYKTDRPKRRRVSQVQLYALAMERATGLPASGIVLEV